MRVSTTSTVEGIFPVGLRCTVDQRPSCWGASGVVIFAVVVVRRPREVAPRQVVLCVPILNRVSHVCPIGPSSRHCNRGRYQLRERHGRSYSLRVIMAGAAEDRAQSRELPCGRHVELVRTAEVLRVRCAPESCHDEGTIVGITSGPLPAGLPVASSCYKCSGMLRRSPNGSQPAKPEAHGT